MLELLIQWNKLYFLEFKQSLSVLIDFCSIFIVSTQVNHVFCVIQGLNFYRAPFTSITLAIAELELVFSLFDEIVCLLLLINIVICFYF